VPLPALEFVVMLLEGFDDDLSRNRYRSDHHYDRDFKDEFQKVFGFNPREDREL
jgi:hypothetical protein